ncbi:unnamed protein product [Urochloa humidicola]
MATARRPLLLCLVRLALCLCCSAPCLRADGGQQRGGYRVEAVAVDEGGTRLRAELVASGGGDASAAYGEDVSKLDVYARCEYMHCMRAPSIHHSLCPAFGLL